ncbi:MAG: hypothetical protein ACPKQO_08095 [Nitrososphaeraceae archaeon]
MSYPPIQPLPQLPLLPNSDSSFSIGDNNLANNNGSEVVTKNEAQ